MHELPPLRHKGRGTVVDVHHTISPPTSRIRIDGESLWPGAPSGESVLPTLAPPDLVLHAVIHLFHEGNLAGGLRDLADIDGLLRHFGAEPGFWDALLARAEEFDARRVLAYGLRYAALLFDTPAPQEVRRQAARWEASPPAQQKMGGRVLATLLAAGGEGGHGARGAAWMLYVRSHWRRMPPLLLARHLLRKAVTRRGADCPVPDRLRAAAQGRWRWCRPSQAPAALRWSEAAELANTWAWASDRISRSPRRTISSAMNCGKTWQNFSKSGMVSRRWSWMSLSRLSRSFQSRSCNCFAHREASSMASSVSGPESVITSPKASPLSACPSACVDGSGPQAPKLVSSPPDLLAIPVPL